MNGKMTIGEELLLSKYNMYYIDYTKKICAKCIGTEKQIRRKCGKLSGHSDLSCNVMEACITRKLKTEILSNASDLIVKIKYKHLKLKNRFCE